MSAYYGDPESERVFIYDNKDAAEYIRSDLVPQWQPIETAPLHEDLLLWCEGDILKGYKLTFGWCVGFDREDDAIYVNPTHWQPLPTPPPAT